VIAHLGLEGAGSWLALSLGEIGLIARIRGYRVGLVVSRLSHPNDAA
jgi:hypothetical protein